MRTRNLVLLYLLLIATPGWAETITFKPGEISASVKGVLVADQTKEYIFRGQAGQSFELLARSDRGEHLIVHVRDKDQKDVFNNFESGRLKGKGVLPSTGDYTVYLSLRRAEVQREGRVDYLITLTLHDGPVPVAIEKGHGQYFVSDGGGNRNVQSVGVGLGTSGQAIIVVQLEGDGFTVKGTWKAQTDEAILIDLTEAFGQKISGQGIVVLDDEVNDKGDPTHILLRFEAPTQKTHHSLYFGD